MYMLVPDDQKNDGGDAEYDNHSDGGRGALLAAVAFADETGRTVIRGRSTPS